MKQILLFPILFNLFLMPCLAQTQEAQKFDEFGDIGCEDAMARSDTFAQQVMQNSQSQGYIIYYEGKHLLYDKKLDKNRDYLPRRNEAYMTANTWLTYLIRKREFNRNLFKLINGGFRERFTVEFWIAPKEYQPKPSPTMESKDIKFRKGITRISGCIWFY